MCIAYKGVILVVNLEYLLFFLLIIFSSFVFFCTKKNIMLYGAVALVYGAVVLVHDAVVSV